MRRTERGARSALRCRSMEQAPPGPWASLPWFMVTVPSARTEVLDRPRLDQLLETTVAQAPVTVVAAPSGYGKTVAVAQWARGRTETAWLSATTAAETIGLLRGGVLGLLPAAERLRLATLDPEQPAPGLLELLALLPEPATMVVDDAHLLDLPVVRSSVATEAVADSGLLRLVLVGHSSLESAWSREVATGRARVVRPADLAFTLSETRQVVERLGVDASSAEVARIQAETEGWPVAVRLRLLAGRDSSAIRPATTSGDRPPPEVADGEPAVDALLVDYIETAVLSTLPPELAGFVLDAVLCPRADSALLSAFTGCGDAHQAMGRCLEAGLFVDRYTAPDGRTVYRWHDAFASHARAIAARRDPARVRRLEGQIARLLTADYPATAVRHALRAGEAELAAGIIRRNWLRLLLASQSATVNALCLQLPVPWQEQADILLIRACCCELLGDDEGALLLRRRAQTHDGSEGSAAFVRRFADLLLAADPAEKSAAADAAYALLATADGDDDHCHGLFLLGWVELRLRRDPERAVRVLTSAVREAQARGLTSLASHAGANRAFAMTYSGHFAAAAEALQELTATPVFEAGDWELFDAGLGDFARGYAAHWRGHLDLALRHFSAVVAAGGASSSFTGLARVYYALTVAALSRAGEYGAAELILDEVEAVDRQGVPWAAYKRMAAARLLEAQGDVPAARNAADPLINRSGIAVTHAFLADFYRRIGQSSQAFIVLQQIRPRECPSYARVSALVTLAALELATSRPEDSRRHFDRALDLAAVEGAYFPFLGQDPGLTDLLHAHASSGTRHEERLAEIFALREGLPKSHAGALTAREEELLRYLRTTMTTQEIAAALHVSVNTVKTHLRSIYRKLGVGNRREAVRLVR